MPDPDSIPRFAFPFARGANGTINAVEQDSEEHIHACAMNVVSCPVGYRHEMPEFGWPFPEFRPAPLDTSELTDALRRWEPRARPTAYESADIIQPAIRNIKAFLS
jgi:phage baseplate assembly protein W